MVGSLRTRITLVLIVVVLALAAAGHLLDVPPAVTATMVVIVMVGILMVSTMHSGVLARARRQIEEYVATPELGAPDPPPPDELVPFFDLVMRMQDMLTSETRRLRDETEARRKLDEAIARASRALQSRPGVAGRAEAFLDEIFRETDTTAGAWFTWEHTGLPPTLTAWKGPGAAMPEKSLSLTAPEKELIAGRVVFLPDLKDEDLSSVFRAWAAERGFASAVLMPVLRDTRTIGFAVVFSATRKDGDPRVRAYLEALRAPAGWAQDAAMRYEKAVEDNRITRTLNELLMAAGSCWGLDEAASETLQHLYDLEPYSRGAVLLVETDEFLEVFSPTREGEAGYFLGSRMRREGSCAARAMETRAILITDDLSHEPPCSEDNLLMDEGYKSRLVIPLVAGGKAIGCVYLVNRAVGAFSKGRAEELRKPLEAVAVALEVLRFNRELTSKVASLDTGITEKGLFVTGLNHEIRSQLRAMTELAEPLLDRKASGLKSKGAEAVQEVLARARQLLGMLDGVVDIERADAGAKSLHLEEFFVADLIKDVLWDLQSVLKSRNLETAWEVPQGLPPMVADADRFRSLLFQLMGRAAQVTPQGGQITFRANMLTSSWLKDRAREFMPASVIQALEPGQDVMVFYITDQGDMLPAALRDTLFSEGGTPGMDSETAFKLYFVRRVVEMHRGHIWMEPGPEGKGNRVGVVMPQYSIDRVGFVNYVGKRLKEARETLSCLSLISVGYADRAKMREGMGEDTFYRAMKELEGIVRQVIREPVDSVRRFHNGELIVVFAETDRSGAARMVERLLSRVGQFESSVLGLTPEVVTSVATYPDDALRPEDIIRHLEIGVAAVSGKR